jgi:predicted acylesterase/phospholipase RssA
MTASQTVTRPPRTAFVFTGGGSLGAVQVGMLRALTAYGVRPKTTYADRPSTLMTLT